MQDATLFTKHRAKRPIFGEGFSLFTIVATVSWNNALSPNAVAFLAKGVFAVFSQRGLPHAPRCQKSMDAHGHTILCASGLFHALDVPANLHGFKRAQLFHLKATFQQVNAFCTSHKVISPWHPDRPHTILYQQAVQGTMVI